MIYPLFVCKPRSSQLSVFFDCRRIVRKSPISADGDISVLLQESIGADNNYKPQGQHAGSGEFKM
uniref:Uncharacterized protein n=1 Tax=Hyaloperonospora arabidopsidis (strain Emoy2) TaxID=559515 RepID=M4BHI0_HYAAE